MAESTQQRTAGLLRGGRTGSERAAESKRRADAKAGMERGGGRSCDGKSEGEMDGSGKRGLVYESRIMCMEAAGACGDLVCAKPSSDAIWAGR